MKKIFITGATDGIGLETAKRLAALGHHLLISGRNPAKLETTTATLKAFNSATPVEIFQADLSDMGEVRALTAALKSAHSHIDVIINNAGILKAPQTVTPAGLDIRFAVNTLAPYLLNKTLLPIMTNTGRVINLSSAAQESVDHDALRGTLTLSDMAAYSQSKLAITMWSREMSKSLGEAGPVIVAVNPGSLLASKMVSEGFGIQGKDIGIGADILVRAALSDEFADASGKYYDNDAQQFSAPHPDALDAKKSGDVVKVIEDLIG